MELAGLNLLSTLYLGALYVNYAIYAIDTYWTSMMHSVYAKPSSIRSNDLNPNQPVVKRAEPDLLLAGQRNRRKSYDTLAFEKGQSTGNHFQHPGKDLSDA